MPNINNNNNRTPLKYGFDLIHFTAVYFYSFYYNINNSQAHFLLIEIFIFFTRVDHIVFHAD